VSLKQHRGPDVVINSVQSVGEPIVVACAPRCATIVQTSQFSGIEQSSVVIHNKTVVNQPLGHPAVVIHSVRRADEAIHVPSAWHGAVVTETSRTSPCVSVVKDLDKPNCYNLGSCASPVSYGGHSSQLNDLDPSLSSIRYSFTNCLMDHKAKAPWPLFPYESKQKRSTLHWGQRKLLLSEIQFCLDIIHLHMDDPHYLENSLLVYAGSAPGNHILEFVKLFPNLALLCYDPSPFCLELIEYSDKVDNCVLIQAKFVPSRFYDESMLLPRAHLLFVSDVRSNFSPGAKECDGSWNKLFEQTVRDEMNMQHNWVAQIVPDHSLLKFRLPYAHQQVNYFPGKLHLPIWGRVNTTELRLHVIGVPDDIVYDSGYAEGAMSFFNTVYRACNYDQWLSDATDLPLGCLTNSSLGLDGCFDCASECAIAYHVSQLLLLDKDIMCTKEHIWKLVGRWNSCSPTGRTLCTGNLVSSDTTVPRQMLEAVGYGATIATRLSTAQHAYLKYSEWYVCGMFTEQSIAVNSISLFHGRRVDLFDVFDSKVSDFLSYMKFDKTLKTLVIMLGHARSRHTTRCNGIFVDLCSPGSQIPISDKGFPNKLTKVGISHFIANGYVFQGKQQQFYIKYISGSTIVYAPGVPIAHESYSLNELSDSVREILHDELPPILHVLLDYFLISYNVHVVRDDVLFEVNDQAKLDYAPTPGPCWMAKGSSSVKAYIAKYPYQFCALVGKYDVFSYYVNYHVSNKIYHYVYESKWQAILSLIDLCEQVAYSVPTISRYQICEKNIIGVDGWERSWDTCVCGDRLLVSKCPVCGDWIDLPSNSQMSK
jgi:hypothetical protein